MCPRSKINLGIGAYGRSWTLADRTKSTLGSAAWSPGSAGACTGEAGYMSWQEIKQLIAQGAKVGGGALALEGAGGARLEVCGRLLGGCVTCARRGRSRVPCRCPCQPPNPPLPSLHLPCTPWASCLLSVFTALHVSLMRMGYPTCIPHPQVTIDEGAMAAYMVSGSTWVAFDLPQTIYMKILAARKRGLGGLMVGLPARVCVGLMVCACVWCVGPGGERQYGLGGLVGGWVVLVWSCGCIGCGRAGGKKQRGTAGLWMGGPAAPARERQGGAGLGRPAWQGEAPALTACRLRACGTAVGRFPGRQQRHHHEPAQVPGGSWPVPGPKLHANLQRETPAAALRLPLPALRAALCRRQGAIVRVLCSRWVPVCCPCLPAAPLPGRQACAALPIGG